MRVGLSPHVVLRFALAWLIVMVTPMAESSAQSEAKDVLEARTYADIPGWADDDHQAALQTFQRSCVEILNTGHGFKRNTRFGGSRDMWRDLCEESLTAKDPRRFFESQFLAFEIKDPERPAGLLTGYYEPEAMGSLVKTNEYQVPIYAKPKDLVALDKEAQSALGLTYGRSLNGKSEPYFTRQEIEAGALSGKALEIVWLKSWEDAFFIHIQGSGRVRLPDGNEIRLAYAAKSGLPYTAIGGVLIARGILTKATNSMQSIRAWMSQHPESARELMWHNQSFVFFRRVEITDKNLGALAAQQVNLTPERSLAVDRSQWMFGTPIWIDTTLPPESTEGAKSYRRLMIAQDTGSAIKGLARGDIYWGWGERAALIAGHMKGRGKMIVLLPKPVAKALDLFR